MRSPGRPNGEPNFETYADVYDAYRVTHHERKLLRQCLASLDYYRRRARSLPVEDRAPLTPATLLDRYAMRRDVEYPRGNPYFFGVKAQCQPIGTHGAHVDATAPVRQVIVELVSGDVFTFEPEDLDHISVGDVLSEGRPEMLEFVVQTLREPDGWVAFGGATMAAPEHEWDEPNPEAAAYSRTTIFARHVVQLVTVYDEPPRMDLPAMWA